jgi:hypothetical protein
MTWKQSASVLLAVGLAALVAAWCNSRVSPSGPIEPTPTMTLVVIVLSPSSTAAGTPALPSPTALPSHTPGASSGAVVVGETALPTSTTIPTALPTLIPAPTLDAATPTPARTMVQRG